MFIRGTLCQALSKQHEKDMRALEDEYKNGRLDGKAVENILEQGELVGKWKCVPSFLTTTTTGSNPLSGKGKSYATHVDDGWGLRVPISREDDDIAPF